MDLNKLCETLTIEEMVELDQIIGKRLRPVPAPLGHEITTWMRKADTRISFIAAFRKRTKCTLKEAGEVVDRFYGLSEPKT